MRMPEAPSELAEAIRRLDSEGRIYIFYKSPQWRRLRARVMEQQANECEMCRERGIYRRAVTVHHVRHVRSRPDLALSETYEDAAGVHRNLVALCADCHNETHGRRPQQRAKAEPLNAERW